MKIGLGQTEVSPTIWQTHHMVWHLMLVPVSKYVGQVAQITDKYLEGQQQRHIHN